MHTAVGSGIRLTWVQLSAQPLPNCKPEQVTAFLRLLIGKIRVMIGPILKSYKDLT